MRASRLVSIILWLQNEGILSAGELAGRLEVSKRTILRDMEELSAAGIPVYAERGQHGGWKLTEGYRTSLTGMNGEELAALLLSSQAEPLGALGQLKALQSALQKLLAASSETAKKSAAAARSKLHIDGAGWHEPREPATGEERPLLTIIQEAVWSGRKLRLTSLRDGESVERLVSPLGLVVKRGVWYLVAALEEQNASVGTLAPMLDVQAQTVRQGAPMMSDAKEYVVRQSSPALAREAKEQQQESPPLLRTFRISRLANAELTNEESQIPHGFRLEDYWNQSLIQFKEQLPRLPARARLKERAVNLLESERYVEVGKREPSPDKEGWIEAELIFQSMESAKRIALSCGSAIEVLEPEELRRCVADEIRSASVLY